MTRKYPRNPHLVDIVDLNNDSISYLKWGEPEEAYKLLSEALDLLQLSSSTQKPGQGIRMPTRNGYGFQWRDVGTACFSTVDSTADPRSDCAKSSTPPPSTCVDTESHGFFLFHKGLSIQMPSKKDLRREVFCPFGLLWALNYNLALTCHMLALGRSGIPRQNLLREALQLYDFVLSYLQQQRPSLHFTILLMAILNNKMFLCQDLSMEEDERCCFSVLKSLIDSTKKTNASLSWWRHFYLNIFSLEQQGALAAAA